MSNSERRPTVLAMQDRRSLAQNACFECGCYKGKPCGDGARPIEGSEVSFAKEETSTTEATPKTSANVTPFTMHWTYGINVQVPVLNLTNEFGSVLIYASSHCCTVYDYEVGISHFLHGHQNKITSVTCETSGTYAAIADSGEDNIITVWDITKCIPINTIFDPHNNQTTSVISMSPDGKYLASVSNGRTCSFNLWKWSLGEQQPNGSLNLKSHGTPVNIAFNPNVTEHIMIAFQKQVVFVVWNDSKGDFDEPVIPEIRKQKQIGTITGCTYIDKSHNAVASTNEGCILVFGNTLYTQQYEMAEPKNEKIFVKTIKVSTTVINCISSVDGLIVTGDAEGNIRFYDKAIQLLYWSQSCALPAICSISFDLIPRLYEIRDSTNVNAADETLLTLDGYEDRSTEYEILYRKMIPTDFTIKEQLFVCRNFIVAAGNGSIHRIDYIHPSQAPLYHEADDVVAGIDVHDEKPMLLIAYANGQVCMYNYLTHERVIQFILPETFDEEEELATLTFIKYSPQALHLACSKSNGEIWLLDQTLLTPKYETPLQGSKYKIEKLCFSLDCKNLAYYDIERTVGLYKYSSESKIWVFYGKTRAHYMPILEMLFSPYSPSRLFTLAQDRNLTEYNLECAPGEFSIKNVDRIEQIAIPITFMYYPPTGGKSRYFLMTDNQFKYKKINDITGMCHSIVLGPAYGCYKNSPVYHMAMIPQQDNKFFVFATEKHIGIQTLPADGNPYKFLGLTGHPNKIKDLRISRCGKFLFTIGENDRTVISWNVHINAAETFCSYGGVDLEPYYCLIEGSRNGWLFGEMQDLFYYMQVLHHGENTITSRQVSDYIPIDELPDLMRACGYYLSEFEAENLTTDITYTDTDLTGESRLDVSFVEFVQLYINHRPAHGVSCKELQNAFNVLVMKVGDPDTDTIDREDFVDALCTTAEPMDPQQLHKCLCALMGEDRSYNSKPADFDFLPEQITFEIFLEEILGIDLRKKVEESEAGVEESSDTGNFMT